MEKKRKRASFSPTITIDTVSKKETQKEEKPVLQQVVEVVVEEPEEKLPTVSIDEHDHKVVPLEEPQAEEAVKATVIDEAELRERLKEELKAELKQEMEREFLAKQKQQEENEVEQEEPSDYKVRYKKIVHTEPPEEEQEQPQEETEEEEVHVQKKYKHAEEKQSDDVEVESTDSMDEETEELKQKETVAELFGKNSETIMPEITVHKSASTRGLLIWAITMVAIAIGVGGGLVIFTNRSNQAPNPPVSTPGGENITPTSAPSAVSSPSPSPKPTSVSIIKKDIKIQVQNGGGVVGAGSKMKSFLEQKGYTVSDVGNASNYSYEDTDILVKQSKAEIRDTLEEDLSQSYTVGTVETTLPESSPYDARVIVGKN